MAYKDKLKEKAYRRKRLSTPTGRYKVYQSSAKCKGLEFRITFDEFCQIVSKLCAYCGSKERVGVDRIDNTIGYLKDNCSPCCTMCNMMKRNLPENIFLEHCEKITEFNRFK